jgi:uncharacterized protein involved in type VI secretion and phage assembly
VKFPWLSDVDESNWARVAALMAGKEMGTYFLPEVDDEVLVAFEHGRIDRPVVIGSLWNGKDKPPADNGDGKNNVRVIKSRSGHTITLDDTEGSEKITIADGKEKSSVVFDAANGSLSITSEGDVTVHAKGKLMLQSDVEVTVKGASSGKIALQSDTEIAIKGPTGVNINDGKLKVQ